MIKLFITYMAVSLLKDNLQKNPTKQTKNTADSLLNGEMLASFHLM